MTSQVHVRLADLPLALAMELQELRHRYAAALAQAAEGNFSADEDLRALSRRLGGILAREARQPAERRGATMREVSMAVDRLFPELREWTLLTALDARLAARTAQADPVERAS